MQPRRDRTLIPIVRHFQLRLRTISLPTVGADVVEAGLQEPRLLGHLGTPQHPEQFDLRFDLGCILR